MSKDNYTRFIMLDRSGQSTYPPSSTTREAAPSHFYAVASPTTLPGILAGQTCRAVHTRPAPPEDERTAERRFPMRTLLEIGGEVADVPDDVRYLGSTIHLGVA